MKDPTKLAKKAVHDALVARISTVEAKLKTLKARAETAKANVEIKAIAKLLVVRPMIKQVHELKKLSDDRWERAKGQLEAKVTEFEKAAKAIASKFKRS